MAVNGSTEERIHEWECVSDLDYFAVGFVVQYALLLIQLQQTSRMAEFGPTTFGSSSRNLHTSQMRQHDQSAQYKYLELL